MNHYTPQMMRADSDRALLARRERRQKLIRARYEALHRRKPALATSMMLAAIITLPHIIAHVYA